MRNHQKLSRIAIALSVMAFTLIAPLLPANACSCVQPDAAEFLANSDFVFVGALVANPLAAGGFNDVSEAPYTFDVEAVYKGDIRDRQIQVWSATSGAACGFELGVGEPVGVSASFFSGRLSSGLCSVIGADELIAVAEQQGVLPILPDQQAIGETALEPDSSEQPASSSQMILSIAGLAALLAGGGWFLLKNREDSAS